MKLMIVDDNEQMRRMMTLLFSDDAEEIIQYADGVEAVEHYSKDLPDYVLMDIGMKYMDGLSAAREIINSDPAAKIIIVTQHNTSTFRNAAFNVGAIGFVVKDNLLKIREFFIQ